MASSEPNDPIPLPPHPPVSDEPTSPPSGLLGDEGNVDQAQPTHDPDGPVTNEGGNK